MLRTFRINLLFDYCNDTLRDAYLDSFGVQTLASLRELRRKSALFPSESKLLKLGRSTLQEHIPRALGQTYGSSQANEEEPFTLQ